MSPTMMVGDKIKVRKIDPEIIIEGDIVTYKLKGELVTHRVVYIIYIANIKHYITKGDNNEFIY